MEKPTYDVISGEARFLDPSRYGFYRLEHTQLSLSEDEEAVVKFDVARSFVLDSGELELQAGAKARRRSKTYDLQLDYYDGYSGSYTLADVLGRQDYGLAPIDPVPAPGATAGHFYGNAANYELSDLDTAFESAIADYSVDEDINAGYVLARYRSGPLRMVGGVRVEQTQNDIRGNLVELVEAGATRNGGVLADDTVFVTPQSFSRDYTDWLPSATIRYEAAPNLILRGGAFRSVVRPGIGKIAPRFIIEESDAGEREGEFGNPDLQPFEAWNFDVSAEWYFAPEAVLSGGVFYKKIDNFIVDAEFEDGVFNGVPYDEAVIPINGEEATVKGFEFNYQQVLAFLPQPLDGFLVGFNYTYTDSEGDVLGRKIPLPASAENTFNATLGYEKGPVSLRLAASYRDMYLDELGGDDRARPDQAHLALQHVEELRQFIEARLAQEGAERGDPADLGGDVVGGQVDVEPVLSGARFGHDLQEDAGSAVGRSGQERPVLPGLRLEAGDSLPEGEHHLEVVDVDRDAGQLHSHGVLLGRNQ